MSNFSERLMSLKKPDEKIGSFFKSLKITTSNVIAWRGGSRPSLPIIERIAELRGVSKAWLAWGDEYPRETSEHVRTAPRGQQAPKFPPTSYDPTTSGHKRPPTS